MLYRYDVSVTPAATGRKLTQIIRLLLDAPELAEYKHDMVSDFKSTLICRQKFDDQAVKIAYRQEGEEEPRDNGPQYEVKLQLTNTLATAELIGYLTSTNPSAQYDDKLPLIQALNIFLNHYAKSTNNLATIGSSKMFSLSEDSDTWDLGSCLTAIRGFFASVRAATARVLVNVNPSHGAFFQEGPLDQFILRLGSGRGLYKLQTFIKGLRIKTTHLRTKVDKNGKEIPRVKTIWALANPNDGYNSAHPPRVSAFGAGPKNVEFWLDGGPCSGQAQPGPSSGKKKKGAKGQESGRYISVYDFFATCESSSCRLKQCLN